jgi:hypothetical protein
MTVRRHCRWPHTSEIVEPERSFPAGLSHFPSLVGNFGSGTIMSFEADGTSRGLLAGQDGRPIVIDGLWALAFGNGGNGGRPGTLYFTAGPNGESHGLFGGLDPVPATQPGEGHGKGDGKGHGKGHGNDNDNGYGNGNGNSNGHGKGPGHGNGKGHGKH